MKDILIIEGENFMFGELPINIKIVDNEPVFNVEDVARAFGITQERNLKDGSTSINVRWDEVYKDLVALQKSHDYGIFSKLSNRQKASIRKELKQLYLKENEVYKWAFKVRTEQCEKFINWLADIVLPHIRKYGFYTSGMENMTPDEIQTRHQELLERYFLRKWGIDIRLEFTKSIHEILKPKDNYVYAQYTNVIYLGLFDERADKLREINGLDNDKNKKANLRDYADSSTSKSIQEAENFTINLLRAGIIDTKQLTQMIKNWSKSQGLSRKYVVDQVKVTSTKAKRELANHIAQ